MLKVMRDKSKELKSILWVVVASFVVGFVVLAQGGLGSARLAGERTVVAEVGDRKITLDELQTRLAREDEQLRQMLGQAYDPSQFLDAEVTLSALIDRAVLLEEAKRMGLEVAPEQVAARIRSFEAFHDATGRFDRAAYTNYLGNTRTRASDFEKGIVEDLQIETVTGLMRSGIVVTEADVRDEWSRRNESVSIEYATWPLDEHLAAVDASDDEIAARHAADPSKYDAGPGRRIRWIHLDRSALRESLEDEAEMRAYYDANLADIYTLGPEQRRASTILVEVAQGADEGTRATARAEAEALATRARSGEDFAALAREHSDDEGTRENGGDLGPFDQGTLHAAVDAAVFAADEGAIVGPVETDRGYELLLVTKGAGTKPRTFEDVRTMVAQGLYAKEAADAVQSATTRFQAAVADGKSFEDAAEEAGVEPSEPTWINQVDPIPGLGQNPLVSAAAFRVEVGAISEPVLSPGGQVLLTVLEERDSSPRTVDEARDDIANDVRQEKALALATTAAEEARSRAAAGTPFAEAVAPRAVAKAGPIQRDAPVPEVGNAPDLVTKAFATEAGAVGRVAESPRGAVVFRVTERIGFDAARFETERAEVERRLRDQRFQSLRQEALAHLREGYGGKIVTYPKLLPTFGTRGG